MYLPRTHSPHLPCLRLMAAAMLSAFLSISGAAHATVTTGTMSVARMFHQASALPDGRVLLTGGLVKPGSAPYASAELYDPATGLFTPVAPMQTARTTHAAVTLSDGRVMVIGGSVNTGGSLVGTNTSEIFDPATGQWTSGGTMNLARWRPLARMLPNGKVFVMNADGYSAYAEVYDPQTKLFTKTGNMAEMPSWQGVVVLADGRVMSVGGYTAQGYRKNAAIWDPATNQWTATGAMAEARQDIRPILLADGKVLVAGGRNVANLNTTEIYDPATGVFTAGSRMPDYMTVDSSATLPDGDIVLTGPYYKYLMHYDVATSIWNVTGPKANTQRAGSTTLLPGGHLLLAGGAANNDASNYAAVWNQACAPQKITLKEAAQTLPGDGGTASITVSAAPGCRFEAAGLPAWLVVSGVNPMQMPAAGTTVVSFKAAVNSTGASRSAAFMLGNTAATVTQPPSASCPATPTVSPASFTFSYGAQSGTIGVSTVASCPWTISSLPSWVSATSATSGTGSGNVTFAVPVNTGVARSGNGKLDALGGSTSFSFSQAAGPTCPAPVLLSSGAPASGNLQPSSCAPGARGAGYKTDRYTFTGAAGQQVTIFASSSSFDTYLYLRSPAGSVINSNDDGGGGTNSRIPASSGTYTLPAGTSGIYTIEVSSYSPSGAGPYSLSLTK